MGRRLRVVGLLLVAWLGACAPAGPSAYVSFNLVPDSNCVYSAHGGTDSKFYPIGLYDIFRSDTCNHPYVVNLLVNSFLRSNANHTVGRSEPNILQIHDATVHLTDLNGRSLVFQPKNASPLPNPFSVKTANSLPPGTETSPSTGVVSIEAIPNTYARYLTNFAKSEGQVLADIQIFGTTTGDVDVDFKPFTYPIEICDGCLHVCQSYLDMKNLQRSDIVGSKCDDNSGNDDRVCIDPDPGC